MASPLFQPDILGMTSACKLQAASEGASTSEHPFRRSLSLSVSLPLFGLNSDSGMIDAFDVFQVEWCSGGERDREREGVMYEGRGR